MQVTSRNNSSNLREDLEPKKLSSLQKKPFWTWIGGLFRSSISITCRDFAEGRCNVTDLQTTLNRQLPDVDAKIELSTVDSSLKLRLRGHCSKIAQEVLLSLPTIRSLDAVDTAWDKHLETAVREHSSLRQLSLRQSTHPFSQPFATLPSLVQLDLVNPTNPTDSSARITRRDKSLHLDVAGPNVSKTLTAVSEIFSHIESISLSDTTWNHDLERVLDQFPSLRHLALRRVTALDPGYFRRRDSLQEVRLLALSGRDEASATLHLVGGHLALTLHNSGALLDRFLRLFPDLSGLRIIGSGWSDAIAQLPLLRTLCLDSIDERPIKRVTALQSLEKLVITSLHNARRPHQLISLLSRHHIYLESRWNGWDELLQTPKRNVGVSRARRSRKRAKSHTSIASITPRAIHYSRGAATTLAQAALSISGYGTPTLILATSAAGTVLSHLPSLYDGYLNATATPWSTRWLMNKIRIAFGTQHEVFTASMEALTQLWSHTSGNSVWKNYSPYLIAGATLVTCYTAHRYLKQHGDNESDSD